MIDTHTHLNFEAFAGKQLEVVERAIAAGVKKMIVVGTDSQSSKEAVEVAKQHPALYASVGIHPHHAQEIFDLPDSEQRLAREINSLKELAGEPKVVAIGEVGLDFHIYTKTKYMAIDKAEEKERLYRWQRQLLTAQVQLALELGKPLIIHSREAGAKVLEVITEAAAGQPIRGVFHCFEGSFKNLKRVLEAGFEVSFTGNITYVPDRSKVAAQVPLNNLLLETDSPYMTPVPKRGQVNEPVNVKYIAEHHAGVRNLPIDEIIERTSSNAERLFGLS
jgi:TatD DNase family protein